MRIPVGILGATGEVGQKFVLNLQEHPWFEIVGLYASKRSAGRTYGKALNYGEETSRWFCAGEPKRDILDIQVGNVDEPDEGIDLFFSALPSEAALDVEGKIAKKKPVISTASAYRYFDDSFVFLPGVNESHAGMIKIQRERRGWKGFVVPQPNCTTIGLAMSLKPIYADFGLRRVIMVSMQAVSGAGYEAVGKWAEQRKIQGIELPRPLEEFIPNTFEGNVIPHIPKEEEKVKRETLKLLGEFDGERIKQASFQIACKCNRVPVLEGHTESVFIETERKCGVNELKESWRKYRGEAQRLNLPSASPHPIVVKDEVDRPQPRFDANTEGGMCVVIGGVESNVFENGFQYTVLSHNTELGAAKGAVLAAEYLLKTGWI